MKYLIISDAASMHVYNFIINSLLGRGYEIYVLRHSTMDIPKQYKDFYAANNIKVFSPGKASDKRCIISTSIRFLRKCSFLLKLGHVDVCHIHYAHRSSCILYKIFRFNFKKMILSFWGTDILNPPPIEAKQQESILKYADAITCTVEYTKEVFQKRFGHNYDDKLYFGKFAAGAMDFIRDYSEKTTRDECRTIFNIPQGKICIVCGYNANPAQHQDVILEEISLLQKNLKDHIHLIIPLQYGIIDKNYVQTVEEKAKHSDCSYEIFKEYVPFERNAQLALATDIYLNLRDTDAFSNVMKEQLFAGSLMIQGNWLKYKELEKINANIIKIGYISQLHKVLTDVISNYNMPKNHQLFYPLYDIFSIKAARCSWDSVIKAIT